MRVFFDTEFTGLHQHTTLISIGLVAEDGRTFYAECTDYDKGQVDEWLRDNVIAYLWHLDSPTLNPRFDPEMKHLSYCGERSVITGLLTQWLGMFDQVEMWGDVLAYDWVLFCELFGGGAECLPRNVYYIPFDLATLFKIKGVDPNTDRQAFASGIWDERHNALHDAQAILMCYEQLVKR